LPALERAERVRDPQAVLAWEHDNQRFVLRDHWKLVWVAGSYGPTPKAWQLFDLDNDRAEANDVAAAHPDVVAELTAAWDAYAARTGVVLLPPPVAPDAGADGDVGDAGID
jgi:arylsulfatase